MKNNVKLCLYDRNLCAKLKLYVPMYSSIVLKFINERRLVYLIIIVHTSLKCGWMIMICGCNATYVMTNLM